MVSYNVVIGNPLRQKRLPLDATGEIDLPSYAKTIRLCAC